MNKKAIFKLIKHLFEFTICFFDIFSKRSNKPLNENTLLLIRLDAIGDYVLFRNFIQTIKESKKYSNHKIILVGNIIWKNLAEEYDSFFIEEFIWINTKKFLTNIKYRLNVINKIESKRAETVFQPTFSREYFIDRIIKHIGAKEKIGVDSYCRNILPFQKRISDKYYTNLIRIDNEILFEFDKNKKIFDAFLGTHININKPLIPALDEDFLIKGKYIVLFPDAVASYRRWHHNNFSEIAINIAKKYGYLIIIAGTNKTLSQSILENTKSINITDFTGKTSLKQFSQLLKNAELLISNDTSAVHIAIAVNTTTICISNGNHFGRFVPYPNNIFDKIYTIFPSEINTEEEKHCDLEKKYRFGSTLNINRISVQEVWKLIQKII